MPYVPGPTDGGSWKDLPDPSTPVPAAWYTQADTVLAVLDNTAVPALQTAVAAETTRAEAAEATLTTGVAAAARVVEGPLSFLDARVGGVGDNSTDNTTAWNAAMTLLASGGECYVPAGVYRISGTTSAVPGGVWVRGAGYDYSDPTVAAPSRGSVLRATASMARLVQLSPTNTGASSNPGDTGASIRGLSLDGHDLATAVVQTEGRRNNILDCQIYWGASYAVWFDGQNSIMRNSVVAQHDTGDGVLVSNYFDHKITDNQIRQFGTTGAGIRCNNVNDIMIARNHIFTGSNGVAAVGAGDIVIGGNTSKMVIANNSFDGVLGPQILLDAASSTQRDITIIGNLFFSPNITDNTYSAIKAQGTSALLSSISVIGNVISGVSTTQRYKAIIEFGTGITSTVRWTLMGNAGTFVQLLVSGTPPNAVYQRGNTVRNDTTTILSDASGRATLSGTGSQTAFTIAHGLASAPSSVRVVAGSAAAAAAFFATSDSTNITVTFTAAPASGTNNVILNWIAEV